MTGKDKCKILKEIRRQIAEQNEIEWVVSECKHKGNCRGTCPKCESEVRKLERELDLRRKIGKKIALAGISAAFIAGLAGCGIARGGSGPVGGGGDDLSGAVPYIEETTGDEIFLDGDVAEPESETDIYILDGEVASEDDWLSGYVGE